MPHTILIAEDEPPILAMIQKELQSRGYMVLTANNGQTAISSAKKFKPDVIVLDVAMPMTSGLKAYESLRALPETSKIPVIFLTGLPSANVYPTVAHGVKVAHLKKPVDLDDLVSLIQQFLPKG